MAPNLIASQVCHHLFIFAVKYVRVWKICAAADQQSYFVNVANGLFGEDQERVKVLIELQTLCL